MTIRKATTLTNINASKITIGELNEAQLANVEGGVGMFYEPFPRTDVFYHKNCGGKILNVGNPFQECVCSKCGETHYLCRSFDYIIIDNEDF